VHLLYEIICNPDDEIRSRYAGSILKLMDDRGLVDAMQVLLQEVRKSVGLHSRITDHVDVRTIMRNLRLLRSGKASTEIIQEIAQRKEMSNRTFKGMCKLGRGRFGSAPFSDEPDFPKGWKDALAIYERRGVPIMLVVEWLSKAKGTTRFADKVPNLGVCRRIRA
jgi:hypothetical protein